MCGRRGIRKSVEGKKSGLRVDGGAVVGREPETDAGYVVLRDGENVPLVV